MAAMERQQARIEGQVTALTATVAQSNVTLAEIGTDIRWIKDTLDKKVDRASEQSAAASGRATMSRVLSIIAVLIAIIAGLVGVTLPLPIP